MGISVYIAEFSTHIMQTLGYTGLAFMMMLESMVAPVPSELVMPFAGFLIQQNEFTWIGAIAASSLGTIIGSLIGYFMGKLGGYPTVHYFGRYLLLEREHLEYTAKWFEKHGEITVFISRFIPVIRHLISIPAGIANMNLLRFSLFTLIGGTLWNSLLLFVGFKLREKWKIVETYSHQIDMVMVVVLIGVGGWWVWNQLERRKRKAIGNREEMTS